MTTTLISEVGNEGQRQRAGHLSYWLTVFGLATADGACFVLSSLLLRHGSSVPGLLIMNGRPGGASHTPVDVFLILAVAFVAVRYLSGDYARRQLFWDGTKSTTIALLITALPDVTMATLGPHGLATGHVIASWVALLFAIPVARQCARVIMTRMGLWQIPTVMIGTSPRTAQIFEAFRQSLSLGFDIRWLVQEGPETGLPSGMSGVRAVRSNEPAHIALVMRDAACKQAIIAAEDVQLAHFADIAQRLLESNIPVAIIPALTRLPLAGATTSYFFGRDVLMLQVRSNVQRLPWRIVKRSFDVLGSLVLLALFSPLLIVLAIAIERADPGPVTYGHIRVGRRGIPFKCLKLRTMVHDADKALHRWSIENPELYEEYRKTFKLKDDPRITPIGRWLRRTSLDELPQLWNVLRGDMSLVGPRPVMREELDEHYGPAAQLYLRTRPGMTGLWQVSGRSDTSYERRVVLDEWYILNWSFWYDIVIMIQTAWIVLTGKGAF